MSRLPEAHRDTAEPFRVLFVDDDKKLLDAASRALSGYFEVETVGDANEALERFKGGSNYSLVIADQWMPGMCGVGLIQSLREIAPETPCLLMTGDPGDPAVLRCVVDGLALGLLEKPVWPAEIVRAVLAAASPTPRSAIGVM